MQIAAGVITYYGVVQAKNTIEADGGKFNVSDVFTNTTFRCVSSLRGVSACPASSVARLPKAVLRFQKELSK